ncbi:MAG: hypothetical protein NVSMB60_08000 [Mycobacterium sp.]
MPTTIIVPPPSKPFFRTPDGWDAGWQAAKAASATTQARMVILGDSDSSGYGPSLTNWYTQRWSTLLRTQLVAKYGSGGDFFPATLQADWVALNGTNFFTRQGATPMTAIVAGYDRSMYPNAVYTNVAFQTFVGPYAHTDFDIHYVDAVAASWGYTIDAGAQQTITQNTLTYRQNKRSHTGLSSIAHSIVFNNATVGTALLLAGISTFPTAASRTSGIGIANMAAAGSAAADWLVGNGFPPDMIVQFAGTYGGWVVTGITNTINPTITISPAPTVAMSVGQWVSITGVVGATGFANVSPNFGYWKVASVPTATTFTVTMPAPGVWTSGGVVYGEDSFGWPSAPDLLVIMLGANDNLQALGVSACSDAMRRMCQAARRAKPNCSILFIPNSLPDPYADVRYKGANSESWMLYVQAIRQIANVFNAAIYDLSADMGERGYTYGYMDQGDFHFNIAGHQHISDMLSPRLV